MHRQPRLSLELLLCLATLPYCVYAQSYAYYYAQPQLQVPSQPLRPQLVLYNPFSGQQMEPLRLLRGPKQQMVSGNIVSLPQLWQPCSCSDFSCTCCLGLALSESFNQRLCAVMEYNAQQLSLQMRIEHNQRVVAKFGFSARNPPDYCVPLVVPLPLFSCLRLYDIEVVGNGGNVQMCISLVFKVLTNQLYEYRFDCVRFGADGVFFMRDVELSSAEQQLEGAEGDKQKQGQPTTASIVSTSQPFSNDKLADEDGTDFYRLG